MRRRWHRSAPARGRMQAQQNPRRNGHWPPALSGGSQAAPAPAEAKEEGKGPRGQEGAEAKSGASFCGSFSCRLAAKALRKASLGSPRGDVVSHGSAVSASSSLGAGGELGEGLGKRSQRRVRRLHQARQQLSGAAPSCPHPPRKDSYVTHFSLHGNFSAASACCFSLRTAATKLATGNTVPAEIAVARGFRCPWPSVASASLRAQCGRHVKCWALGACAWAEAFQVEHLENLRGHLRRVGTGRTTTACRMPHRVACRNARSAVGASSRASKGAGAICSSSA